MNDWYTIKIHAYRKWLAKKLGNSLFSGPQNKTLEKALQTAENVPKSKRWAFVDRFRGEESIFLTRKLHFWNYLGVISGGRHLHEIMERHHGYITKKAWKLYFGSFFGPRLVVFGYNERFLINIWSLGAILDNNSHFKTQNKFLFGSYSRDLAQSTP